MATANDSTGGVSPQQGGTEKQPAANSTTAKVTRVESGWPAHFICADRCIFHRATYLTCNGETIVVSTVGAMRNKPFGDYETIGYKRYYETMAFVSMLCECGCGTLKANSNYEISFDSDWSINSATKEDVAKADPMHEAVVAELTRRLENGERLAADAIAKATGKDGGA